MRGSPIIRSLLVVAVLLGLLAPIRCMTSRRPAARPPTASTVPPLRQVEIELTSSSAPFKFAVSHLGKVVWQGESAVATARKTLPMAFPNEGVDLYVEAEWPADAPSALRVALTPPDAQRIERTLWGERSASDALTFP